MKVVTRTKLIPETPAECGVLKCAICEYDGGTKRPCNDKAWKIKAGAVKGLMESLNGGVPVELGK